MTPYLPAVTTVLGALIALAGVALTARAADRREYSNRLWDKRAELFVDALQFLNQIRRSAPVQRHDLAFPEWSRDTDRLAARLVVFGDKDLEDAFFEAARPAHDRPPHPEYPESAWSYASLLPFEDLARARLLRPAARPSRSRHARPSQ